MIFVEAPSSESLVICHVEASGALAETINPDIVVLPAMLIPKS